MFAKLAVVFVIFQYIDGSPIEPAQYDPKDFLSSRIVGGEDAPDGVAPYMAALVSGSLVKWLSCGASIISHRHLLSAAHCIEPFVIWGVLSPDFKGVIGSNYWNSSNFVEFKEHIIHPGWSWVNLKNDIGVLVTTKKIEFSDRIAPIALNFNFIGGGVPSFVTGWGRLEAWGAIPHRLQILNVNILSPRECVDGIYQASQIWGSAPPVDSNVEMCTFHSRGHGMCNGDSGSALVLAGSGTQAGLVTWGFPCALGAPDVFVRLSAFKDFLMNALQSRID